MSSLACRQLTSFRRCRVCPTGLFMADGRRRRVTVEVVRSSLIGRRRFFGDVNSNVGTRHVGRHIRCSVRVVGRLKRYSNVRGCSECFSNQRRKRHPCYLLSFFPGSFLLIMSRDRIDVPRVNTVCNNSETQGGGLIRCNFQLPTTFSGHPLAFRRFRDVVRRTVCIDTAPTSCRLERSRNIMMRRLVHPAKLLSPRVRIHPDRGRVSSLLSRVLAEARQSRHMLVAALAGHVTRRLARFLLGRGMGTTCVRDSITALSHIGVVGSLQTNICSMLINIGLLHRNLSLPRMSLITVLSTSGRKFLHDRHSLARATNHTTEGMGNGIVVCTSGVASDVLGAVSRATHQEDVRLGCGTSRKVAPGRVRGTVASTLPVNGRRRTTSNTTAVGDVGDTRGTGNVVSRGDVGKTRKSERHICVRPSDTAVITSPVIHDVDERRLRGDVTGAATLVGRTTGSLSFVRTTRCHSRVVQLRGRLRRGK